MYSASAERFLATLTAHRATINEMMSFNMWNESAIRANELTVYPMMISKRKNTVSITKRVVILISFLDNAIAGVVGGGEDAVITVLVLKQRIVWLYQRKAALAAKNKETSGSGDVQIERCYVSILICGCVCV